MLPVPELRVASLAIIRPHEEVDPLRVDRLAGRIEADGTQLNPVVVVEDPSGDLVLLDGATRTAALQRLGLGYAVVQVVDERTVSLERWHHVIRGVEPAGVIAQIEANTELFVGPEDGCPCVATPDGHRLTVFGDGLSLFAIFSAVVHAYVGRWSVSRVTDQERDTVPDRFPDWAALVEFPVLTMGDVTKAALGDDLLPAGITRFNVPERALRVNADLDILRLPGSEADKQQLLDRLIHARATSGRIRHYEHSVYIFDD